MISVALGALTINALEAVDRVVLTINPQLLAIMGLQVFLKIIKKIKSRINPKLEVEGILLTGAASGVGTQMISMDKIEPFHE